MGQGALGVGAASVSREGVGRAVGSLDRQVVRRAAKAGSAEATSDIRDGLGSSKATRCMTSTPVPSPKGAWPVTAYTRVAAREKTSEAESQRPSRRYSGDMYAGVPTRFPVVVMALLSTA